MSLSEVHDKRTGQKDCHLPAFCGTESIAYQCCGTLRSQETLERVGQLGWIHLLLVRPLPGLRITHTLGIISLISVYAPTVVSEFSVKEAFYAQLQMAVNQGDTLIILGDSSATTGTDKEGNGLFFDLNDSIKRRKKCSLTLRKLGD